ncbi:hypothetical protein G7Z17_g3124 [Cylindrodendrum hubeiense]|uniref:NAD-dependent epimerase/dehydratase domain-containing protein n=1 Tax=Cylindrodendrum hubeiense TaxID=595255 RepID=A0A9P5HHJ4_9HYPO|nr:hypothetical protein G7Z17_g3124 [Cylindrodendrum hubeiense]
MAATSLNIENPALSSDSIVAVSGANGFIASHIVDQLLVAGYRVRGTVRDASRTGWLQSHFDATYGADRFTLVEVPDITTDGAFDEALKGVHGVVHTLAITNLDPNPDNVVPINVATTLSIARSAAKSPSVIRFVYTSSAGAAAIPKPGKEYVVNQDTYNEEAVAISYSGKGPQGPAGGYLAYSAAKTKAEKALWKWYKEEKPNFVLNSVVPNAALGQVLQPQHQGFPTTVGLLRPIWEGHLAQELVYMFPAHVQGERLISYAGRFNLNDILSAFRQLHPDRSFPADIPNLAQDTGKIDNQRGTELIRRLGRPGWVTLEESLKPLTEQFAEAEKS